MATIISNGSRPLVPSSNQWLGALVMVEHESEFFREFMRPATMEMSIYLRYWIIFGTIKSKDVTEDPKDTAEIGQYK